ncbi:MAG: T9SS type A sorting domain-containing protein [Bacteroidia bacterium]
MKKLAAILVTLFLLQASSTKGQISLDTVVTTSYGIGWDFYTVQISSTETKYLFADMSANTFSLFNMDFTPFMLNIAVPEPFAPGLYGFQVLYVTRTLFDCDSSNVEYMYETPAGGHRTFYIMRTDGTQLFTLDSAYAPYCSGGCLGYSDVIKPIRNTSDGAKLFLYRQSSPMSSYIYSLCGTLLDDGFDLSKINQSFVKIFPNPASGSLTFEVNPPDNINEYEVVIFDNNAKELKREKVQRGKYRYTIDVSAFSNGTYFYTLCTKNKSYQSGKFVITR